MSAFCRVCNNNCVTYPHQHNSEHKNPLPQIFMPWLHLNVARVCVLLVSAVFWFRQRPQVAARYFGGTHWVDLFAAQEQSGVVNSAAPKSKGGYQAGFQAFNLQSMELRDMHISLYQLRTFRTWMYCGYLQNEIHNSCGRILQHTFLARLHRMRHFEFKFQIVSVAIIFVQNRSNSDAESLQSRMAAWWNDANDKSNC